MTDVRWRLPSSWEWAQATEFATVVGGGTPRNAIESDNFSEDGIPWLTPADLSGYKKIHISKGARTLSDHGFRNSSAQLVPKGTVLFTSRAPVGYCVVASNEISTNQGFKNFIPEGGISPEFLRYYLLNSKSYAESKASGTTFLELSKKKAGELSFPIAPINEQHRIVEKIDALMERSTEVKAALDAIFPLIDQYRQSVLVGTFRGEFTKEWRGQNPEIEPAEELIDSLAMSSCSGSKLHEKVKPFFDIPRNWKWTSLVDLLCEGPNNGYSPKSGSDATGTLSLKLSATTKGFFDVSETTVKRLYEKIDDSSKLWLESDDLLIQRANSLEYVGTSAIFRGPSKTYIYPDLMMRVRIKHDGIRSYVWRYLNSDIARRYFRANATGTAGNMPKINRKTVNNLPIPIPPESELFVINHRINHAMAMADGINNIVHNAIEKQSSLNRSFLAKAFRGELVPQDPRDEPSGAVLMRIKAERDANQKVRKKNTRKGTIKMKRQKSSTEIISVARALKLAGTTLSAQDLLVKAGYPRDVSIDQLEQFFLDIREDLKMGTIACVRKGNDDIFTLAE